MRLSSILKRTPFLWRYADQLAWRGSRPYWEARYSGGGNSGAGSYGHLAHYKADILNEFVEFRQVESVIEFGCGDGNQLSLARYQSYIGLDVSKTAIKKCVSLFHEDSTKHFFLYTPDKFGRDVNKYAADLGISLDVVYHLVEDKLFTFYMKHLFEVSQKWVIIYSSNHNEIIKGSHVRHRRFTEHVAANFKQWRLTQKLENRYPSAQCGVEIGSFADFYFFEKF
jgi:SAM-dependent methyltransferase